MHPVQTEEVEPVKEAIDEITTRLTLKTRNSCKEINEMAKKKKEVYDLKMLFFLNMKVLKQKEDKKETTSLKVSPGN